MSEFQIITTVLFKIFFFKIFFEGQNFISLKIVTQVIRSGDRFIFPAVWPLTTVHVCLFKLIAWLPDYLLCPLTISCGLLTWQQYTLDTSFHHKQETVHFKNTTCLKDLDARTETRLNCLRVDYGWEVTFRYFWVRMRITFQFSVGKRRK